MTHAVATSSHCLASGTRHGDQSQKTVHPKSKSTSHRKQFISSQSLSFQTMRIGFSLSPGGLLLPYHLGVLDGLKYHGYLNDATPLAGSSAGAIAAAAHACSVDSRVVLDATIDVSHRCASLGGARGRLLPLLREKLDVFLNEECFDNMLKREGGVAIAYRQLFPSNRPILQTDFKERKDIIDAVCYSSMFPFFATNWPAALDTSERIPKVMVDGFFTVPRDRFGCPDFKMADVNVDRTVMVSVFPRDSVGLTAASPEDCICPAEDVSASTLLQLATEASSASSLIAVYESGFEDAERWCRLQECDTVSIAGFGNPDSRSATELN